MGRGEPTVGSWGCFSGGISLNMNCFVWSILGFFCPSLVAVFPPPKNLFTTWNLISLFNSSDQRPELWFWREQSPWADSMKLLSNQPQPLPGLHLCFSQCWPQCFSPTVWAVSHLSSPSSFKTTHTHSVAIDAGQPVCVWKSICMSDWVKWTLFWGQKNRWTHWAKPKAHTHTQYIHLHLSLPFSYTHTERHRCICQSRRQCNNFKDWDLQWEKIAAPPQYGRMTSEAWVAEGCHDLEGKGVGGKGQDKRGRNRGGCGRLAPIINNPDLME